MVKKQYVGFLNTPPLWTKEQFGITQFEFPEIDLNDFVPRPFPNNIRLGHQMEHVFKQFITHDINYRVVLHNIPVRAGNQTLGEIDFVLKDVRRNQIVHVELTYKFYIINTHISEPIHRLMGPNKKDMFFTKMEKIKNQQFQLLHSEEGIDILKNHSISHLEVTHEACYKAQLFIPFKETNINIRPLNKACIIGFWLRFDDFNSQAFQEYQFYVPSKSEWVIRPHDHVNWQSHFDMLIEINLRMLKENAPMVWIKKSANQFEKCFVVWW
ncbi:MAG: DUF1853 family protein [Bacteroidota bacterium]